MLDERRSSAPPAPRIRYGRAEAGVAGVDPAIDALRTIGSARTSSFKLDMIVATAVTGAMRSGTHQRRSNPGPVQESDLADLDAVLDETFDAAINWFSSFGYHDDITNKAILANYHRVLRPGGTLLIETLHHDWFVRHHVPTPLAQITNVGDDIMFDQKSFDPRTGRVNTVRTVISDGQIRRSQHFVRLPSAPELETWLEGAGFDEITVTGRAGSPLTVDSRRMLAIART